MNLGESELSCGVDDFAWDGAELPRRWSRSDSLLLADHTTFHLGGPARHMVVAETEKELIDAVEQADRDGLDLLVLSGGSNILVADEGFDGLVVCVDTRGIRAEVSSCAGAFVTVAAGESWDDFVAYCIEHSWAGVEALSAIPGLVGATPIQNVGAYGQEVATTIARVRCWDRHTHQQRTFSAEECHFAYRDSIFKRSVAAGQASGRYVVLDVSFHMRLASLSEPIRYAQLAQTLGVSIGQRVDAAQVRKAVIELRRSKAMVYDPTDHDSWSAGSFFTNPIVDEDLAAQLPSDAPRFDVGAGKVKLSAAWLIDHAGCHRGYPGHGQARLSSKHVLALTNRGGAKSADILALARDVAGCVYDSYGVRLSCEPVMVGMS